jgi:alpha-L-arabinofuranosidase
MKARIVVDRDFSVGEIDPRIYGAFLEHMGRAVYGGVYEPGHPSADKDGFRGDVLDLVRALDLPLVRYPGGNFVSGYDWENGVGPRESRPVRLDLAWRSRDTNAFGTDEFARWCALVGTEPMLAVNLGTRGIDAARSLLEYCNHPGGTHWSDLRARNGRKEPHGVRLWCLGNEMDGPWQIGHKTALEYGRLANETAKAMRQVDGKIELVACGSSSSFMPTHPEWEATVLDQCYDAVDHVSAHMYFDNNEGDFLNFMAKPLVMDRYIATVASVADTVKAKKRSRKSVHVAFDEWNVWYHDRRADMERVKTWDWPVAPPLLEEAFTFEDALVVASILNTFIRRADRVKIACIAQLVNVIAPIRTRSGGPAWRQTIYHPLQLASLHGRGEALQVAVDVPAYDAPAAAGVPYLDVSAVMNSDGETLTFFMVNRDPEEAMAIEIAMTGFAAKAVAGHVTLAHPDLRASNTEAKPDAVALRKGRGIALRNGALRGRLPPRSYHMLRVSV